MDEQRMMLFAPEEFLGGGQLGVHNTYFHKSRIFMHYRVRTAFYRTQSIHYCILETTSGFNIQIVNSLM